MREYRIELLDAAWKELDEIADMHLLLVGPDSAQKIIDKILNSLDNLADNPYMGREPKHMLLAEQGFRVLNTGKYLCFYKVVTDVVRIYHIVDGRRNYPKLFYDVNMDT